MSHSLEMAEQQQDHAVDRQCAAVRENGEPCRGTPALGEAYCHAHARFRQGVGSSSLLIPLVDDDASITFVRSQALRAMALGTIPPENGHAILAGCRDAERRLDRRLAVRNAALRYAALAEKIGAAKLDGLMGRYVNGMEEGAERASAAEEAKQAESGPTWLDQLISETKLGAEVFRERARQREEERARQVAIAAEWYRKEEQRKAGIVDDQPAPSAPQPENGELAGAAVEQPEESGGERPASGGHLPENGRGDLAAAAVQLPENEKPQPAEPDPVMHRSIFPAVKQDWDRALARTEGKIADVLWRQQGESWEDYWARRKQREAAIAAAM